MTREAWNPPQKEGLYDPAFEKDACGVGFIVSIDGQRSHKVSINKSNQFGSRVVVVIIILKSFPVHDPVATA